MGISRDAAYNLLWLIYRKAGVDDVALLICWPSRPAWTNRSPERPADLPKPQPMVSKGRFKMNRLRRSGVLHY